MSRFPKELDDFLCEKFPILYRQRNLPMYESCMHFGFDCEDGWAKIIYDLSAQLEFLSNAFDVQIEAAQIKEKFAGLRFYIDIVAREGTEKNIIDSVRSIAHSLISNAESISYYTCEKCGTRYHDVQVRTDMGWHRTLCQPCYEKHIAAIDAKIAEAKKAEKEFKK